MSEVKLFGKKIQLPSNDDVSLAPRGGADLVLLDCEGNSDHNSLSCPDGSVSPKSIHDKPDKSNESMDSKPDDGSFKDEEERSEGSSSQETPLKKPDKILPCPRCNSMDTKFCYFNNYNVNQPRHFCKGCQRYWTAGGAIRNVPIGSGCRKAKSSPHPHPIVIPDIANGTDYPTFMFGSDAPLRESVVSALNIAENSAHCAPNGFIQPEAKQLPKKSFHGLSPQVPCYAAPPWYPASYLPPGIPVSIYATPPFWGPCNIPWPAMSANNSSAGSSPSSPLGKHSREGDVFKSLSCDKEESGEESGRKTKVLVPKTLRIDDPREAAKSSIWATLGIRNGKAVDSINSGGVFGGFQSKGDETNSAAESSLVLQANPAAFSRSLRFHESAE